MFSPDLGFSCEAGRMRAAGLLTGSSSLSIMMTSEALGGGVLSARAFLLRDAAADAAVASSLAGLFLREDPLCGGLRFQVGTCCRAGFILD